MKNALNGCGSLVLLLLAASGCGPSGTSTGPAANGPSAAAQVTPPPTSTANIDRSQMREHAVALLQASATGKLPEERANAMEALLPVPTRLEPLARRALSDENLGVRAVAATLIGKARLTRVVDAVIPLLTEESPMVRACAIFALSRCGREVDIEPLAQMLRDPQPLVRAQTAFLLGEMGNTSALPMLRDASRDPMSMANSAEVKLMRLQLAEAMVKLGDQGAIEEIRAALFPARPEDLEATALAVQIIGQVNDEKSAYQLKRLALDGEPPKGQMPAEVRLGCAAVLARIGLPRGDGSFMGDEFFNSPSAPLRGQAAAVYGATGKLGNLPRLADMMKDKEPLVRVAAAAAVLKITERSNGGGGE